MFTKRYIFYPQKSAEQIYSQMEFMQTENEILKSELGIAQERISSLQTHLANVSLDKIMTFRRRKALTYSFHFISCRQKAKKTAFMTGSEN